MAPTSLDLQALVAFLHDKAQRAWDGASRRRHVVSAVRQASEAERELARRLVAARLRVIPNPFTPEECNREIEHDLTVAQRLDAEAEVFNTLVGMVHSLVRATTRLEELLAGDGFTSTEADTESYCPMCGRSRSDGHREACGRYVLADVCALLREAPRPGEAYPQSRSEREIAQLREECARRTAVTSDQERDIAKLSTDLEALRTTSAEVLQAYSRAHAELTETKAAFTTLRGKAISAWEAWGQTLSDVGDVDNCDDCHAISATGIDLCGVHRADALWRAMRDMARVLAKCQCGHAVDQHNDEDDTRCRECVCLAMKLAIDRPDTEWPQEHTSAPAPDRPHSYGLPADCRIAASELEHKVTEVCDLLRDAATQLDAKPCTWREQQDGEFWQTDCGQAFVWEDGPPSKHHVTFCGHCGRAITEVAFTDDADDESEVG